MRAVATGNVYFHPLGMSIESNEVALFILLYSGPVINMHGCLSKYYYEVVKPGL